jgi:hypothetical protein
VLQPKSNSNKANVIIVAASSTQVDIEQNANKTHAGRTLDIYIYSILAVLAVSDNFLGNIIIFLKEIVELEAKTACISLTL